MRRVVVFACLVAMLNSCTTSSQTCDPVDRIGQSGNRQVLHLYVSNQSFEIDPAAIQVYIDEEPVVCQEFKVDNQHNWILFDVELDGGTHSLRAVANGVARLEESFDISGERWAVVDFWFSPDDPLQQLTFSIHDAPIGFA